MTDKAVTDKAATAKTVSDKTVSDEAPSDKGASDAVNVLVVDDEPERLSAYGEILGGLDVNLVTTSSAAGALEFLLDNDAAVVVVRLGPPECDGLQLAASIRAHKRFRKSAVIFIAEPQCSDADRLRAYEMGAADCVPAPIVPGVLRVKVRLFADLFRKNRELEVLNSDLERRVAERTAALEASNVRVKQSERGRSLALAAGQMGSWEWEIGGDELQWDEGQHRIFGVEPKTFRATTQNVRRLIHREDWASLQYVIKHMSKSDRTHQIEFRVLRPNGETRWCAGAAAATVDAAGRVVRISGVTVDITDRKEAEAHQALLVREVDHRARNALAVIQSIIRLTRAGSVDDYVAAIEGRIKALARAHTLLSDSRWRGADLPALIAEELEPYRAADKVVIGGPDASLQPATAQGLALALHELATNAAKHGALSAANGKVSLFWQLQRDRLVLDWIESGGPPVVPPAAKSFGLRVVRASIEQQLDGETMFDWDRSGLRCRFSVPFHAAPKARRSAVAPKTVPLRGPSRAAGSAVRPRVLLVEDEALVAMMIQEYLGDFGYRVIGPISTAAEAAAQVRDGQFEAAVLDIALGDEAVYPIADTLAARSVPFVFVTGYDADSVDVRFRTIPVLQKPIERDALKRVFAAGPAR